MFGNALLGLTSISWLTLAIITFQKINTPGQNLVGLGFILFALMAVYVVSSLLLTISVAAKGGFNWLSDAASSRKIMVGILWLGMVSGVVFCSMLTTEFHTDQSTGIARLLSLPVYFGAVWLPLLMLAPYAILLNPGWRDTLSPYLYKIPLAIAWASGLLIVMAPGIVVSLGISIPQKEIDNSEQIFKNETNSINSQTSILEILKFSLDEDERVRRAAWTKIKSNQNWEDELVKILEENGPYGIYNFYWVYVFLNDNKTEHPERFVESINNTIPAITAQFQDALNKSSHYSGDLTILNIEVVCHVLDAQFKDSSKVFRPNMLKLLEALETPPLEGTGDDQDFIELRNKYRLAVKNWLDSH